MNKQIKIKVKLTNKEEIVHTLDIQKQQNFYSVSCIKNKEKIGFINFEIKNNKTWIYKIETNKNYLHQGVGTALIDMMEYISMLNKIERVEGKYYPENEYAKTFYEKYGYYIPNQKRSWDEYDETWTMFKNLDYNKIKQNMATNLVQDDVQEASL